MLVDWLGYNQLSHTWYESQLVPAKPAEIWTVYDRLKFKAFFSYLPKTFAQYCIYWQIGISEYKSLLFFFFRPVDKYVASHRYVWSGSDFLMVHGKEGITEVNACVIHHSHMYFFFLTEMSRAIVVRRIGVIGLSCVYIRMLFNIFIFFLFFLSSLVG